MTTTTVILNAILALGVIVMVVAPLVWAILTQQRDHRRLAFSDGARPRPRHPEARRPEPQRSYRPVTGRA